MEGDIWRNVERREPSRDRRFTGTPGQRNPDNRAHSPKVAGSNPAPATKKTLGIPTCAEGFPAFGDTGSTHVKPVSNIDRRSDMGSSGGTCTHKGCESMGSLQRCGGLRDCRDLTLRTRSIVLAVAGALSISVWHGSDACAAERVWFSVRLSRTH